MANPTTNYGFVLPTPTDLVTDLPADFDVALQGVDTRLKALQPGTTLGDIAYSSATANTNTRLGIGSAGQVLTVSSGVPAWTTPTGGGSNFVALNGTGTTLSGSSTSITGLSGYDKYYVLIVGASSSNAANFFIQFNSDTTNKYGGGALSLNASTGAINIIAATFSDINNDSQIVLGGTNAAASAIMATMSIYGANSSGAKIIEKQVGCSSTDGNYVTIDTSIYTGSSVISSIQLKTTSGTFDQGKIIIYGSAS